MALADQLAAIRAGSGGETAKRRAAAALKARGIANAAKLLSRTYARGQVHWTLIEVAEETAPNGAVMLKVIATAQIGASGPFLIRADDPLNPMYFINPPIMVPDGEEPNPDYDPNYVPPLAGVEDVTKSRPTRPKRREDVSEALRQMLDAKLADKLRG